MTETVVLYVIKKLIEYLFNRIEQKSDVKQKTEAKQEAVDKLNYIVNR